MNQPAAFAESWQRPARFSLAEYDRMLAAGVFADMRVELVDGELVRMSPAHSAHGRTHVALLEQLLPVLKRAGLKSAIDLASVAGPSTVLAPDFAVLTPDAEQKGMVQARHILLAIEVADSSLGRDLGEKQRAYARAGVPHYWVVDVDAQVTHAMSGPAAQGYQTRVVIPFVQPLAVPGTDEAIRLD